MPENTVILSRNVEPFFPQKGFPANTLIPLASECIIRIWTGTPQEQRLQMRRTVTKSSLMEIIQMRRSAFTLFCPVYLTLLVFAGNASAQLSISPSSLQFTVQNGSPSPQQNITVNAPTPTSFTLDTSQTPWIDVVDQPSAKPVQGRAFTTPITLIAAVANPIATSNKSGSLIFNVANSIGGGGTAVPVTITVSTPQPSGILIVTPSALTFDYQSGGPLPPAAGVSIASSGAPITFSMTATTSAGGQWLLVSAPSSTTPTTATVSIVPNAGMQPGVYNGTVTVGPLAGGVTQSIVVTLRVSGGGSLTMSPSSLSFTYQGGGNGVPAQSVTVVNSTGGNVPFNISCLTTNGGGWLSCPGSGSTPTSFVVSVNPAGLSPGSYYGTVNAYPLSGGASATQIPVTLTVYNTPNLLANPSSLTFNYVAGRPAPAAQYISMTSSGNPITFSGFVSGPSFITISPTTATTPAGIAVSVNPPAGVAPGSYNATVVLTPTVGNSVNIPVLVQITAANYLTVSQSSVTFDYTIGSQNPPPAYSSVTSSGPSIRFDAVGSAAGSTPWLKVFQSSLYTPATVTLSAAPQGLAAGTYTGLVWIVSDSADNSPLSINVTLNVTTTQTLSASPWGMAFSYQTGQTSVPFQVAVITSQSPTAFQVTATSAGAPWLIVAGGGTTPATIAAQVNPTGLAPGSYSGAINILPNDQTLLPLQIPVILTVSAQGVFLPAANQLTFQYSIGAPGPDVQQVAINTAGGPPIVFTTVATTGDGNPWLSVAPTSTYAPGDISVAVNTTGLAAGWYYGVVIISDPAGITGTAYIPVSLQVVNGPILNVSGQTLTFTGIAGGVPPASQPVVVNSSGPTQFHVDTSSTSWLQASPTDGTTNATVNLVAVPGNLPPGYYLGLATVSIPGVAGSQQIVPVVFLLNPTI